MLQFLNTFFLAFFAAAGLPVLIHFIARPRAVRVPFSAIRFLKRVKMQRARFDRAREILLLAARFLIVVFIVAAFSRPVVHSGPGGRPGAVALVADCSGSMDRGALFDKALSRLKSYLSTLTPGDRIVLFRPGFSNEAELLDRENIETVLKQSQTARHGDCLQAVDRARMWLAENPAPNPEIVLASDMQAGGFAPRTGTPSISPTRPRMWILPVGGDTENAGVVRCGIENRILEPGARISVGVEIRNYGERSVDELLVGVSLNGAGVSQKAVALGPGEKRRVSFSVEPEPGGWNWGEIRIDGDAFDFDNAASFSFRAPETVPVLLVGKTRRELRPVAAALEPGMERGGAFRTEQAIYSESWAERLKDRKVLVLVNVPGIFGSDAEKLDAFFERGGGLFLVFGKDAIPESDGYRPVTERFGIAFASAMGSGGALSMGTVDFAHPIFEGVFEKGKENIRSPRFFKIVPAAGRMLKTVMALNNGQPLLSEARSGRGSLLVFSGGLDPAWSDIAVSTVFAPLMVRSVLYLAGHAMGEENRCMAGETIHVAVPNDSLQGEWTVETPEGESIRLLPEARGGKAFVRFEGTDLPGIVKFRKNGTIVHVHAVDMDPLESDFRTVSEKSLAALFPEERIRIVGADEHVESAVQEGRTGKELSKIMLLAALGLLVFESILADGWKVK